MVEQVGTTNTFNMPVDEVIDMALQAIGGERVSYEEAKMARNALNLVFIDLQTRAGMAPLSSMQLSEVQLVSGSSLDYALSAGAIHVLDAVVEVSTSSGTTDLPLRRLSYADWLKIPVKSASGQPSMFHVNKQRTHLEVNLWPVPNSGAYTFKAWTINKIADVTQGYQLMDIPTRYLPVIIKGLRYFMADIRRVPLDERMYLKNEYNEALQLALDDDRERTDFNIYPVGRTGLHE